MRANGKNATEGRIDYCQVHARIPIELKQKILMKFGEGEGASVSDAVKKALLAAAGDVVLDLPHMMEVDREQEANYRKRMENRAKLDAAQRGADAYSKKNG